MNEQLRSRITHHMLTAREKKATPFPHSAFVAATLPAVDINGELVSLRALAVRRKSSELHWRYKEESLNIKDRNDYQIIVIPSTPKFPKQENNHMVDVTNEVFDLLIREQKGPYPVADYRESRFANDLEARKIIRDEKKPETAYIIASPTSERDYSLVRLIASRLKKQGTKKVVVMAPFLGFAREDKDAVLDSAGKIIGTGQMLTLRAELQGLRHLVDFIYTFEPHSFATQAWAAEAGIQLAPISLWKFMIDSINKSEELNINNMVCVGPDMGRNIAANRIASYLGIPVVGFNKHRDPALRSIMFDPLNDVQQKIIMGDDNQGGKDFIMFDDEGASLGTSKDIIEKLITNHNPKSIRLILAHRRFTTDFIDYRNEFHDGWERNINTILHLGKKHNVNIKIYLSNSRESIGDIESYQQRFPKQIDLIDILDSVMAQIDNDIGAVNPIQKPENEKEDIILQLDE